MSVLDPGTEVPSFSLATEGGEPFTAKSLRGKTTVLVFYPFAFSPVCTDQLQLYEKELGEITADGAVIYGVPATARGRRKRFAKSSA